jgi:hypothetical protein
MLPPLGPDLTPFRIADSAFEIFNITGFPGKEEIFLPYLKAKSQAHF